MPAPPYAPAVERWGRLDSVVCNAGIGVFGGILDYPDERLAAIVDTNVLGTVWAVRAAVEQFDAAGAGGDIVIVASVAGLGTASGQESVYAATKFGQVGLAISLDRELRPRGIRVSTIAPAAVNTGFADGLGRTAGDPVKQTYLAPRRRRARGHDDARPAPPDAYGALVDVEHERGRLTHQRRARGQRSIIRCMASG